MPFASVTIAAFAIMAKVARWHGHPFGVRDHEG